MKFYCNLICHKKFSRKIKIFEFQKLLELFYNNKLTFFKKFHFKYKFVLKFHCILICHTYITKKMIFKKIQKLLDLFLTKINFKRISFQIQLFHEILWPHSRSRGALEHCSRDFGAEKQRFLM